MRRRTQLIRESANRNGQKDSEGRHQYFNIRSQILEAKYGPLDHQSVTNLSVRHSKSQSLDSSQWNDSMFRRLFQTPNSNTSAYNRHLNTSTSSYNGNNNQSVAIHKRYPSTSSKSSYNSSDTSVVKNTPLTELYAFAGVHHIFDHHKESVTRVKFANNDKSLLATCSLDGTLVICQIIPSPATMIYRLEGHNGGVNDMQWSSTNDLIVTSSVDSTSRVWQVSKGSCMRVLYDKCNANVLCCSFYPANENLIFTGNSKGYIQVYNLSTGIIVNKNCLQKINSQVQCMCFDAVGSNLWVGDNKGSINAFHFDMNTLKLTNTRQFVNNNGYSITSLTFRSWLTKSNSNAAALLANVAPNYLLLYQVSSSGLKLRKRVLNKHNIGDSIRSSFCPMIPAQENVCVVCSGCEEGWVGIFDMENDDKPLVNRLQGHSTVVLDVSFNYDESLLASGDKQGCVIIWKRDSNFKNII